MTREEKQILLKDLCARLPYGHIKCKWIVNSFNPDTFDEELEINEARIAFIEPNTNSVHLCGKEVPVDIGEVKPYLRPMSSMTEEEIDEYRNLSDEVIGSYGPYHREFIAHCVRLGIKPDNPHECVDGFLNMEAIDWLNAHHFDYRGLISMGLALEAPEGMYKTE